MLEVQKITWELTLHTRDSIACWVQHVLTCFNHANHVKEINAWSCSSEDYQPMGTAVKDQVDVVLYDLPQVPSPKYAKQDLAWATVTQEQGSPETLVLLIFNS